MKSSFLTILLIVLFLIAQVKGGNNQRLDTELTEPNGFLSLNEVFALTLIRNPELSAYSYEVRAKEAEVLQNSLLPNPELGVEVEDFGGRSATKGFDTSETTIQISQLIELGGKRGKRTETAKLDKTLADWDYQTRRLDLFAEASKIFVEVLAAQERVSLSTELYKLAGEVQYTVSQRVLAGKESPLEQRKAEVSLSESEITLNNNRRSFDISRAKLASFWGSFKPQFAGLNGNLYEIGPHGSFEEFASKMDNNPDLARWKTEIGQKQSAYKLEKARAIPDITISGGAKYLAEPEETAFIVGVSIPLPIFDRNRGNIQAANARLNRSCELARLVETTLNANLIDFYKSLISAYEEAVNLRDKIIPASQEAFEAASEGYRQGKFDYIVLLDAQRTLFEARQQYLDLLVLYHQAHANVERLAGSQLDLKSEKNK